VRFQYCDMSNSGGESYRHAFSSSITSLSDQVRDNVAFDVLN
jgi:hypothetical protein